MNVLEDIIVDNFAALTTYIVAKNSIETVVRFSSVNTTSKLKIISLQQRTENYTNKIEPRLQDRCIMLYQHGQNAHTVSRAHRETQSVASRSSPQITAAQGVIKSDRQGPSLVPGMRPPCTSHLAKILEKTAKCCTSHGTVCSQDSAATGGWAVGPLKRSHP